jgi:ankyrin repeat domain-containing protein 50
LTVPELIDGIAVDIHESACLDLRRRLQDEDDLREICPGLIDIGVKRDGETKSNSDGDSDIKGMTLTLRIAHFSVQEYLESDRVRQQKAAAFAIESASAHAEIAQICLIYLLEPGLSSGKLDQTKLEEFPLAHFAASFWHHHYKNAAGTTSRLDGLILKMFQHGQSSFYASVKLHDPERPWDTKVDFARDPSSIASPVYYASLLGLDGVLRGLIDICQDNRERKDLVNAQGGAYGNALQAASFKGHDKIVRMLIDAGADVNAQDGHGNNALQEASSRDHDKVVRMLIDAGADVNAQDGHGNNALQAASSRDHDKVVRMLIDAGADMNAQDGHGNNALQEASVRNHDKVVRMLIDAGADVNAQGGRGNNALQAASFEGHDKVVRMLIDAGADVNAHNALNPVGPETRAGEYGNALQAASVRGHDKVVRTLMDAGADINIQGGKYDNALFAASFKHHDKVIRMLRNAGAYVNAQGEDYLNALMAAYDKRLDKLERILSALDRDRSEVKGNGRNWN